LQMGEHSFVLDSATQVSYLQVVLWFSKIFVWHLHKGLYICHRIWFPLRLMQKIRPAKWEH
jgi:hypothetical protein